MTKLEMETVNMAIALLKRLKADSEYEIVDKSQELAKEFLTRLSFVAKPEEKLKTAEVVKRLKLTEENMSKFNPMLNHYAGSFLPKMGKLMSLISTMYLPELNYKLVKKSIDGSSMYMLVKQINQE